MGYSFEEFFDDEVVPKMKELFSSSDKENIAENFLDILRSTLNHHYRGEDFARRLIDVATNSEELEMTPDQFVQKIFNLRYDESIIRKLEYSATDGTIVQVNYRGELEEQELLDKIAERVADKKSGHF